MFRKRAVEAMKRMHMYQTHPDFDQEASRIYVFIGEESALSPLRRLCTRKMVPKCVRCPYGRKTCLPALVSLDAIVPRAKKGSYTHGNVQLIDVGCNFVKLGFDLNEAIALIGVLGDQRDLRVDSNGMLCPASSSRVDHATMSTAVIEAWAKKMLVDRPEALHSRRDLTVRQLVRMIKPFMVTETTYRDPSGAELFLALASPDRIDAQQGYVERLNLLRKSCVNDAPIVAWLKQISPTAIRRGARLQKQNVRLPFSDWGDAILRRRGEFNDPQPLPAETVHEYEDNIE
jgi:hypothetical protein